MSVWASEINSKTYNSQNQLMPDTRRIVVEVNTDSNGQFSINLIPYNVTEVLEVQRFVVGRTLSAATNINTVLQTTIVEVTNSVIKGVVFTGNSVTASLGLLIPSLVKAGSGITVKCCILCR